MPERLLQATCSAGNAFFVISSLFPFTEGCHVANGEVTDDDKDVYLTNTSVVASLEIDGRSDRYWAVVRYPDGVDSVSVDVDVESGEAVCISSNPSDGIAHPTDSTWECDSDGDEVVDELSPDEFSTICGCSNTPAPTAAPTRVPPLNRTCGEPDSIKITTTLFSDLDGCYVETETDNEDRSTYTVSGAIETEQALMFAQQQDDSLTVKWILATNAVVSSSSEATSSPSGDLVVYCESEEEAGDLHPSEVGTWLCDNDDDESSPREEVSRKEFDAVCGCKPESIPVEPSPLMCGEVDDQFRITSTETEAIDGMCFVAANSTNSGFEGSVYTQDGTMEPGQHGVLPAQTSNGDVLWAIKYTARANSSDVDEVYYVSDEEASTVHPTDATWLYFNNEAEAYSDTTGISVDCGCAESRGSRMTPSALSIPFSAATSAGIMAMMILHAVFG